MIDPLQVMPRGLKVFLVIALLGPLIGGAMVFGYILPVAFVSSLTSFEAFLGFVVEAPELIAWIAFFSYLFGGAGALACATVLGVVVATGGRFGYASAVVLGLASSLVLPALLGLAEPDKFKPEDFGIPVVLAAGGLAAAFVCTWLLKRWKLI